MRKRNPFLTALGAFLILLFTGGPILLALIGSIVPDRVMFDPDRGLFDEVTLENYRFIFTGELPPAYLESGANRTMACRTRRARRRARCGTARRSPSPRSDQSHPRRTGRVHLCALYVPGEEAQLCSSSSRRWCRRWR